MTEFIHAIPDWFELMFLTLCIGTLVSRLWVLDASSADSAFSYGGNLFTPMWRFFGIGVGVIIATSIAKLLIAASEMSGQPVTMVFPVLPTVIFRTHAGQVGLIRIMALVLLSITVKAGKRYRDSRGFLLFILSLAVIISMTESASGHASDKGDFSLSEIMDWLHLMAASIWGGGLLVLSIVILPELVTSRDEVAPHIAGVARRFSSFAGLAVGIIALTSLYNALTYVGSFEAFWKAPYGRIILAKIFLFFILLQLGAMNRYINVPLLQEWAGLAPGRQGILNRIVVQFFSRFLRDHSGYAVALRFKRSVRIEACLIIGVLLCAALLRHEIPARHVSHMQHHGGQMHSMPHNDGDSPDMPEHHH